MFYEKLTQFLEEYATIPEQMKDNGVLIRLDAIKEVIKFLTDRHVFTKEEMRKQALKDYYIILPHSYFSI